MWLISQRKFLVPSAAAILAALALVTLTPAAPPPNVPPTAPAKNNAAASTRTLPMPIVIRGKGKAKLSDFAAPTISATKDAPARNGVKLDFKKATPPARLTPAEKAGLVKSVQPALLKINSGFGALKIDLSAQPLTLTPSTPWVDGKASLEFAAFGYPGSFSVRHVLGTTAPEIIFDVADPNAGKVTSEIELYFYAQQAGMYLITMNCSLNQTNPTTFGVTNDGGGTIESPTSSTIGAGGPVIVPIICLVSDVTSLWQGLYIQPSANTNWTFYSVDIQYLSGMPGQ